MSDKTKSALSEQMKRNEAVIRSADSASFVSMLKGASSQLKADMKRVRYSDLRTLAVDSASAKNILRRFSTEELAEIGKTEPALITSNRHVMSVLQPKDLAKMADTMERGERDLIRGHVTNAVDVISAPNPANPAGAPIITYRLRPGFTDPELIETYKFLTGAPVGSSF